MRKLIVVAAVGMVMLGVQMRAAGAIVGYVSDEKCALSGSKSATAAEWIKPAAFESCVKDCLKEGAEPVFVTENNKILKFDAASRKKIDAHLGHKVSVTGKVTGTTIAIDTITDLKL